MRAFEGFSEFVAGHTTALSRVAYLLTGDHQAAQDLLQSALTKAAYRWHKLSRYDRPDAYVRRTMYHEVVTSWRRRRRIAEYSAAEVPETPSTVDEADRADRRLVLERALVQLTPKQRAVLVIRFFEDRSEAEAAELLGCGIGTVKSQTHRALARLRAIAPELVELVETRN